MKDSIEKAIKLLADRITTSITANESMQFSQAALNLIHVLVNQNNLESNK